MKRENKEYYEKIASKVRVDIIKAIYEAGSGHPGGSLSATDIMNAGVSRRQVKGFLKSSDILWLDKLPLEEIYSDEYHCRFHWENKNIREAAASVFADIHCDVHV